MNSKETKTNRYINTSRQVQHVYLDGEKMKVYRNASVVLPNDHPALNTRAFTLQSEMPEAIMKVNANASKVAEENEALKAQLAEMHAKIDALAEAQEKPAKTSEKDAKEADTKTETKTSRSTKTKTSSNGK